ncbi:four helix bundle protein, partial [Candidatus Parcubacteria bacterium]|nr:four helix bundle protein [Candidatus Parcubacteria bacterium]
QLRRASSSITANIAEGFSRYHFKDKIRFYYHSRGSLAEVQNFLLLSKDLSYIDNKLSEELFRKTIDVAKLVNGLIRSTESQIN